MPIQKFSVSRDDSIYHAWPDLALTRGGKLICTFTECKSHGDRVNSRIMLAESSDRGRTWSQKSPFAAVPPSEGFFDTSRIKRMRDGTLIILGNKCGWRKGKETVPPDCSVYMWRGNAEGTKWKPPVILPFDGICPDKPAELSCGRLIISAHNTDCRTNKLAQYLWYSDDGGKTWSERITLASDARYNLCEVSILEMPDETLVAFMREESGLGIDCLKVISRDRGLTWSEVYNVPIPACHRPVAGFLNDGTVMLTHRYMQGGKGWLGWWTQNVFAAFMDAESAAAAGRKEQSVRIMPIDYDRSPQSDLGYTGWVQFADGEIYVVTYIVDDAPKAQIRGYSFNMSDVKLG